MPRRAFFSFHYENDIWRASIVRNSHMTQEKSGFFDGSLWESAKLRGTAALQRLIDDALVGTSVTVVLIGTETSRRLWVEYEIRQSIARRNGMLGVYIHNIKDRSGYSCVAGSNPLPAGYAVYDYIHNDGYSNMGSWIEAAARQAGR